MAPTNLLQSIQGSARDFRKTLFLLFGIFVAGSVIGFLNSLAVIDYLYNVSDKIGILEIHPAEGFLNRFKIAFLIGLIITMPFIFFTLIDLVKRKFPRLGIKNSYLVTAVCYALFMVGALFAFFFIIPLAIDILAGYGGPSTEATYSIGKYVNFVAILTFVFGLSFEMPVVIIAHSYARVIK
ncbi:MAG: twin-arginine translocase subunit TatC, partial [Clostridiales bacterium]|nr:twin-arginine translocase subunit TatC [Clostridiales bacterium]